jgi:hypothetical protein
MEIISKPLRMTEAENREALKVSERRRAREGSSEGNRHDRRLVAKRDRQQQKRELVYDHKM